MHKSHINKHIHNILRLSTHPSFSLLLSPPSLLNLYLSAQFYPALHFSMPLTPLFCFLLQTIFCFMKLILTSRVSIDPTIWVILYYIPNCCVCLLVFSHSSILLFWKFHAFITCYALWVYAFDTTRSCFNLLRRKQACAPCTSTLDAHQSFSSRSVNNQIWTVKRVFFSDKTCKKWFG